MRRNHRFGQTSMAYMSSSMRSGRLPPVCGSLQFLQFHQLRRALSWLWQTHVFRNLRYARRRQHDTQLLQALDGLWPSIYRGVPINAVTVRVVVAPLPTIVPTPLPSASPSGLGLGISIPVAE